MRTWRTGGVLIGSAVLVVSCLASCQAVFTWSPLQFLRRDPATMTVGQQLQYADQALGSGDAAAVQAAYDAISAAANDPANLANPEVQYTAAQLALELSGVSSVFDSLMSGLGSGTGTADPLSLSAATFANIDITMLGNAGTYLQNSATAGASLTATDFLIGAVGLLVTGAPTPPDATTAPDILNGNSHAAAAEAFLAAGVAELATQVPPGDPGLALLQALLDSLPAGSPA
jgi:hypothetical protein